MAISLKHAFTSAQSDSGDTSLVRPSNWNAEHVLQLATARLVGRTTAGTGDAEEISVGSNLTLSAGVLNLASNVVISDNSSGDALRITQTGTGNALRVEDSANPDSTPFIVNTDGNVGIGTQLPTNINASAKLAVVGGDIQVDSASRKIGYVSTGSNDGYLSPYDGSGFTNLYNTFGTGGIRFFTGGSTAANERMRIDSSGNVGIGTTSPSAKLNVYDATSAQISLQGNSSTQLTVNRASTDATQPIVALLKSRGTIASPSAVASGDAAGTVSFQGFGGTNNRAIASISSLVDTYTSDTNISGSLLFNTNGGSTGTTERFRIGSAGQLGIGGATYGTAGQVLTSGGASAAPTWSTVSSDYVSLTSGTATNVSQLDLVLSSYTDYTDFVIVIRELVGATTNSGALQLRTSTDGGTTFSSGSTDYAYRKVGFSGNDTSSNGAIASVTTGLSYIELGPRESSLRDMYGGSTTDPSIACRITINNALSTVGRKRIEFISYQNTASDSTIFTIGHGFRRANTAVNAIRLLRDSTNNNFTCKYELYGIK